MLYDYWGGMFMELNYELTKKDYVNYCAYHHVNSYAHQMAETTKKAIWGIVLFIVAIILSFLTRLSLFGYLLIGFYIHTSRFANNDDESMHKKYMKILDKTVSSAGSPGMFGNHIISVSQMGIKDSSSATTIESRWNVVNKIIETTDLILIYNSDASAFVIPKKSFANENHKEEFLNIMYYFFYRSKLNNIPEAIYVNT